MSNCKLLVVDDEPGITEAIAEVMAEHFDEVFMAENAKQALELFKNNTSDIKVIISDLSMPEAGGIDLLASIRNIDQTIPFLLFTGYGEDSEVMLSMKYKAYDFIEKPDYNKLEYSVISALKNIKTV